MASSVFPAASDGPLRLGAQQVSEPLSFPETAGGTPLAVFLRIVMLGTDCGAPGLPHPTFRLRAGTGDPVEPPEGPPIFLFDRPGAGVNPVARVHRFVEGENVYAIRILIVRPGSAWRLLITNNDAVARHFTWVVADNVEDASQPWLHLPRELRFDCPVGATVAQEVNVRNLGTGDLTVGLGGFATGTKFQLDLRPEDVVPNHCGKLIIKFQAPAASGTFTELYTAKSNDPHATESAHHNNRIRLFATATQPEPVPEPCFEGGRCTRDSCPVFTPPFGPDCSHPIRGRVCQSFNCGHDIDDHLPPQ